MGMEPKEKNYKKQSTDVCGTEKLVDRRYVSFISCVNDLY